MTGTVLVTGATGNVGRSVAEHLVARGESVASAVRDAAKTEVVAGTEAREFDFEDASTWPVALTALIGCSCCGRPRSPMYSATCSR